MGAESFDPFRADSGAPANDASEASVVRSTHPLAHLAHPIEGRPGRAATSSAPSDATSPPPVATRFGRFEVLGRVAVGGMAEIFFARERSAGGGVRQLGLKLLKRRAQRDEDGAYFEEMFQREGRMAMRLAHPNICHVYEFGKVDDRFYISMEWISGRSLHDVLVRLAKRNERLSPSLAAAVAIQVADALHYAHNVRDMHGKALDVVHRDVNPQNIMLRFDGSVQLLDFGVAYVNETQQDTRAGAVKGKINYMAPEQLFEGRAIDCRADVYALGICLYEMLSGVRLQKRPSMRETLKAVLTEPAPALRGGPTGISAALDDVVQRALEKRPEQRFQSAGELQDALEACLAQSGEVASRRRIADLIQSLFPGESDDLQPTLDASDEVMAHLARKDPAPIATPPAPSAPAGASRRGWRSAVALCALVISAVSLFAWSTGREASSASSARVGTHSGGAAVPRSLNVPVDLPSAPPPMADSALPTPLATPGPAAVPPEASKASAKLRSREGSRSSARRKSPAFLAEPGF